MPNKKECPYCGDEMLEALSLITLPFGIIKLKKTIRRDDNVLFAKQMEA